MFGNNFEHASRKVNVSGSAHNSILWPFLLFYPLSKSHIAVIKLFVALLLFEENSRESNDIIQQVEEW